MHHLINRIHRINSNKSDQRTISRPIDKSALIKRSTTTVDQLSRLNDQLRLSLDPTKLERNMIKLHTDRRMYSMIPKLEDKVKPSLRPKVKVEVEAEIKVNNDQVLVHIDKKTPIPSNSVIDEIKKNPIEAMVVIRI